MTCRHLSLLLTAFALTNTMCIADDWPQWGGPQGDCVWREDGITEQLPDTEILPRIWSVPVKDGYSGPAVADGLVYLTDRDHSRRQERVLCFDAENGQEVWKQEYDARYTISYPVGPRATPVVHGERVYTIGAVGHMLCMDAKTGEIQWKKYFPTDFRTELPIWGMAAAPLIDEDRLITLVGGQEGSLVVCFDTATGEEKWRALEDSAVGYCPPVIYEFGGRRQLIIWHPSAVSALDPETGELIWEIPWAIRSGLSIPMPQKVDDKLFMTAFYNGPMMLQVNDSSARILWEGNSDSENESRTDKLHSIMPTPIVNSDYIYGICSYGQLRCLDTKTGDRIWETREATGRGRWWNAFLIPHKERVFIHNEQGDLIIAKLDGSGYHEVSRSRLVEPTQPVQRRMTIWSHPAFAMKSVFARNDKELVRVDLSK